MVGSHVDRWFAISCASCRRYFVQQQLAQKISFARPTTWPRAITTTVPRTAVEAAPPVDLEKLRSTPARILPASPSYFTASPQFNDDFLHLQVLIQKHGSLPTVSADHARKRRWIKLGQLKGQIGEPISSARYSKMTQMLQRLSRIHPDLMPPQVITAMGRFMRPGDPYTAEPLPIQLDQWGRAKAIGRRKTSSAQVWLVEGRGEVLINGKNLIDVFPRMHDRESALWALKITQRMEKYNVWVLASGGGVTGQAEAMTLGLARALLIHEPGLKPILRRGMSEIVPFPVHHQHLQERFLLS